MLNHNYLQVALYKNKIPKSIYEVETGIACNCYCPICDSALEAKNSGKEWDKPLKTGQRIAHFAHSDGSNCSGANESILHLMAKEVLKECLTLKLPPIRYKEVKLKDSMSIKFDNCKLEHRVKVNKTYIQPDVILIKKGKELYIEFYKTHLVDDAKIEKIKELNKSAIEIDLNEIPVLKKGKINKEGIKNNLINNAGNRSWLYNSQMDLLYEKHLEKEKSESKDKEPLEEGVDIFDDNTSNYSRGHLPSRPVYNEEKLNNWKKDLLKQGYKFLKIYKYPMYDWDGRRKYFEGMAEKIYCPKLKNNSQSESIDLYNCKSCKYYRNMIMGDRGDWGVACGFTIDLFMNDDRLKVKTLKEEYLLAYCIYEKYPLIDKRYIQTLMTIYKHLRSEMFPLLEKAEIQNKRLSIVFDPDLDINDQYFIENIKIV